MFLWRCLSHSLGFSFSSLNIFSCQGLSSDKKAGECNHKGMQIFPRVVQSYSYNYIVCFGENWISRRKSKINLNIGKRQREDQCWARMVFFLHTLNSSLNIVPWKKTHSPFALATIVKPSLTIHITASCSLSWEKCFSSLKGRSYKKISEGSIKILSAPFN